MFILNRLGLVDLDLLQRKVAEIIRVTES